MRECRREVSFGDLAGGASTFIDARKEGVCGFSPCSVPRRHRRGRLARWRTAGDASDRRLQQRAVIVAILLICGFAIAFGVVLHGG